MPVVLMGSWEFCLIKISFYFHAYVCVCSAEHKYRYMHIYTDSMDITIIIWKGRCGPNIEIMRIPTPKMKCEPVCKLEIKEFLTNIEEVHAFWLDMNWGLCMLSVHIYQTCITVWLKVRVLINSWKWCKANVQV